MKIIFKDLIKLFHESQYVLVITDNLDYVGRFSMKTINGWVSDKLLEAEVSEIKMDHMEGCTKVIVKVDEQEDDDSRKLFDYFHRKMNRYKEE